MIPLSLSIISSSLLLVIFKYFGRYGVKNFQAIAVNYMVAALLGFALSPVHLPVHVLMVKPWAISAAVIGSLFIGMFYIMALSSQKVGVAISSVANKMSLMIPVVAGVLLYNESLGGLQALGVVLSLIAVVMVIFPKNRPEVDAKFLMLPVVIFIGSGLLDTLFKYVKTYQVDDSEIGLFSSSLFMVSATIGLLVLLFDRMKNGVTLQTKSIVAGLVLGIPNYFSIHFLVTALGLKNLESTVIFPVNNTGVVLLSTLLAILLFKEKLSRLNWSGVVLALISIILIALK